MAEPFSSPAPDGNIVLDINIFARIIRELGKNHSGLTLLVPITKVKKHGIYRTATCQEVLAWAVKQEDR